MLPSSRWKESTVRLPLMPSSFCDARLHLRLGACRTRRGRSPRFASVRARQVVADGVGDDEVAVGQALHERAGAQAVGAVVGEVGLAEHVQARDRAHEVVVHPQPAHRVVRGGIDAHRHLVRVLVGDALVHVEEVAVLLARSSSLAQALDGVGEVEVDARARPGPRRGPRRRPAWPRARRCRAAPGCRSSGTCARGSSRARPRGSGPGGRVSPFFFGTQMRPSLRSDSLISVSLLWWSP